MKYSELHRLLRKYGCYPTGQTHNGHPEWFSPITGVYFITGHHEAEEVRKGTLHKILKSAGVKK